MLTKYKLIFGLCLWTTASCKSTIHVQTRPGDADVYLARRPAGDAPSRTERPSAYNFRVKGAESVRVPYLAWDEYYAWVEADGYEGKLIQVPGQIKIGPVLGCAIPIFLFVPCLWVYGPDGRSMLDVELKPTSKTTE
jgi:hypothetical protein